MSTNNVTLLNSATGNYFNARHQRISHWAQRGLFITAIALVILAGMLRTPLASSVCLIGSAGCLGVIKYLDVALTESDSPDPLGDTNFLAHFFKVITIPVNDKGADWYLATSRCAASEVMVDDIKNMLRLYKENQILVEQHFDSFTLGPSIYKALNRLRPFIESL